MQQMPRSWIYRQVVIIVLVLMSIIIAAIKR